MAICSAGLGGTHNSLCCIFNDCVIGNSGLPTSRLWSEISDYLWYCRFFYHFFLYMLKTTTFFTFHKQNTKQDRLNSSFFTLFCKHGKSVPSPLSFPPPGQAAAKRTLSTSQNFQTFLRHIVGNPATKTLVEYWSFFFLRNKVSLLTH